MTATLEPPQLLQSLTSLDEHSVAREAALARRSQCLAAGLARLGVTAGTPLSVLVCGDHVDDAAVATGAAVILDATVVDHSVAEPRDELTRRLDAHRGGVLLACAEGVDRWRRTGVPMRVVGDGPGVLWWRAMELQEGIECRTTPGTSGSSSSATARC